MFREVNRDLHLLAYVIYIMYRVVCDTQKTNILNFIPNLFFCWCDTDDQRVLGKSVETIIFLCWLNKKNSLVKLWFRLDWTQSTSGKELRIVSESCQYKQKYFFLLHTKEQKNKVRQKRRTIFYPKNTRAKYHDSWW